MYRHSTPSATVSAQPPPLSLTLIGPFTARVGGQVMDLSQLAGRKARTLLKLLAAERGRILSADRIAELLWDEEMPRDTAGSVATLVSRLRALLGAPYIERFAGGYRLAEAPLVHLDFDDVAYLTDDAERLVYAGDVRLATIRAAQAFQLAGVGRALEDEPPAPWITGLEEQRRLLWQQAGRILSVAALRSEQPARAVGALEYLTAAEPWNESLHRLLILVCWALGEIPRAISVYLRLRDRLTEELGVEPSVRTRMLYTALLREDVGQMRDAIGSETQSVVSAFPSAGVD